MRLGVCKKKTNRWTGSSDYRNYKNLQRQCLQQFSWRFWIPSNRWTGYVVQTRRWFHIT